jgi:magnesium chelatase subunit H
MRANAHKAGYRVVIITLDAHVAGPAARASERLLRDFPGLSITIHAAASWGDDPDALERAIEDIATGDIIIANMLFLEEHVRPVLPALMARRDSCDAMVGMIADGDVVRLTRMGGLDMSKPQSGIAKLLKKLRGSSNPARPPARARCACCAGLPKILRFLCRARRRTCAPGS